MIELPESQTLARQLSQTVTGKRIVMVEAGHSPHGFAFYHGDTQGYPALLENKKIEDARAFGGIVVLIIEDARLVLNDGVNLRLLEAAAAPPKKHQLLMRFEDGTGVFATIQMYGGIMAFQQEEYDNSYYQAAREKPSPLVDAFNEAYFENIVKAAPEKLSVKGLLATEQRIPGLGNGCLQDILWNAGLNPRHKVRALSDEQLSELYKSIKTTLKEMTDKGGRNTEKGLYGKPGGYESRLSAKTWQYPCVRCGGAIVRKAYMGGNVYYCEHCQP